MLITKAGRSCHLTQILENDELKTIRPVLGGRTAEVPILTIMDRVTGAQLRRIDLSDSDVDLSALARKRTMVRTRDGFRLVPDYGLRVTWQ